jgi:hypothetical protein
VPIFIGFRLHSALFGFESLPLSTVRMNLVKVNANSTFLELSILSGIRGTDALGKCLGDDTFGNSKSADI